ncbi:MAG: ribosome silencing factor [Desulfobacteraceae bacterium IS3]|nr:MAG: ribosome silencing factor [Desulfobacteraceae bacterium IS3]
MSYEVDPKLDLYVKAVLGKKAYQVAVLDVHTLTSFTDVFIICCGRSNRQVQAIAEFVQEELRKHKIKPLSVEGETEGHWILLDYGHVIIHVFYESVRKFYDLEGLWTDAKRIKTESLMNAEGDDPSQSGDWEDEEEDFEAEIL